MTEDSPKPFAGLSRRMVSILVGLVITLVVGAVAEHFTSPEWLAEARQAQQGWMDAVASTSPTRVGELYWTELQSSFTGSTANGGYSGAGAPEGRGLQSPFWALAITGARLWDATGIVSLVQLALGALAFCVLNIWRSRGETMFFGDLWISLIVSPLAIVLLASVLGWLLYGLMLGALYALSWVTGLAAAAAGATGVVGFCWLCITELVKKGAEHAITPRELT